jgi:hypothetical protein
MSRDRDKCPGKKSSQIWQVKIYSEQKTPSIGYQDVY